MKQITHSTLAEKQKLIKGCLAKRKYWSYKDAEEAMNHYKERNGWIQKVYQCDYCHKFHLTSKVKEHA